MLDPRHHRRILYVHPTLDAAGIPPHAFRVLCHLVRRKGGKRSDPSKNPGIDSIAKACRMRLDVVIKAIQWLEAHDYITVIRTPCRLNRYQIKPKCTQKVFVIPWLASL
jgi:hypothetical protein